MPTKQVVIVGTMTYQDDPVGSGGPVDPGYGRPVPPDVIWGGRPGSGPGGGWVPTPPPGPVDPGYGQQPPSDVIWGGRPPSDPHWPSWSPKPPYLPGYAPGHPLPEPPQPPIGSGGTPTNPINKPPGEAPPGYDWTFEYIPLRGGWCWVLVPEPETGTQEQS